MRAVTPFFQASVKAPPALPSAVGDTGLRRSTAADSIRWVTKASGDFTASPASSLAPTARYTGMSRRRTGISHQAIWKYPWIPNAITRGSSRGGSMWAVWSQPMSSPSSET
jgi:hypothetical protein